MPTLDQLPAAQPLSTADDLVVSQVVGGVRVTGKLTIAQLLATLPLGTLPTAPGPAGAPQLYLNGGVLCFG